MEIVVLEKTKKRIVFELREADNTFCNVLKKEISLDEDVSIATYSVKHPLIGNPKFIVETKGKTPQAALLDAVERLQTKNKEFVSKFKRQTAKK
jgi:DNA-directed RNA polymerase subunit L